MKTLSNDVFWLKIHEEAHRYRLALRVMFELTYQCNFKCRHCYVPSSFRKAYSGRELETWDVFSVLDQLKKSGCFYLGFTGGEPLMRRDFLKIIKYAKKSGFEVIVYTNGFLINKAMATEFRNLGINKVDITIPGISQKVFERVTGVVGSHKKVFRAIELLRQNKVPLGFKTCVLKENETEIRAIRRFASQLRVQHRLDTEPGPRLDGSCQKSEDERQDAGFIPHPVPAFAFGEAGTGGIPPHGRKIERKGAAGASPWGFTCGIGLTQAAITPAGELKMCVMIDRPKYNIFESSLDVCWQKLKDYVGRHDKAGDLRCPQQELKGEA